MRAWVCRSAAVAAVLAIAATGCSASAVEQTQTETLAEPGPGQPELGEVRMARGNWPEEAYHNEVVRVLLQELGYSVERPVPVSPADFYPALAAGEYDLWASGWSATHSAFIDAPGPDGSPIRERFSPTGNLLPGAGLQGLMVDLASVERFEFSTLDQLLENPDAVDHFDRDGDGVVEFNGCNDGWGCYTLFNNTMAANGWESKLSQISGTHSELFAESAERVKQGQPILQYAWTPTDQVGRLVPGVDVGWLAVEQTSALPGNDGASIVPPQSCTNDPCTTMFSPTDIVVFANNDWLVENPPAAVLLRELVLDPVDVTRQILAMSDPTHTPEQTTVDAQRWVDNH